jgi:hypothetical protein
MHDGCGVEVGRCHCSCHTEGSVRAVHCAPCCGSCPICGLDRIKNSHMEAHLKTHESDIRVEPETAS